MASSTLLRFQASIPLSLLHSFPHKQTHPYKQIRDSAEQLLPKSVGGDAAAGVLDIIFVLTEIYQFVNPFPGPPGFEQMWETSRNHPAQESILSFLSYPRIVSKLLHGAET